LWLDPDPQWDSESALGLRIRIQEGEKAPQKMEKIGEISCFEVLDFLF
jgi:hypothetical protein